METMYNEENLKTYDSNIINKYLLLSFNKDWQNFQCDSTLLDLVNSYKNKQWDDKEMYVDLIHTRFISNRNDEWLDSWNDDFDLFMKFLDNPSDTTQQLTDSLKLNLFRNKENLKKLNYIKENSDITDDIILVAKNLSVNNWYHNFWHEIWVAETVIKLCKGENIDKKTLNLLVLAALFHDSWYTKQYEIDLEKLACNLCDTYIPNNIFKQLNITREDLNNLILMTKISNRNESNQEFIKILQDADLWWLWYGPYYILYSCMWMIDEWIISLDNFVEDEKKFIKDNSINWQLFLSKSWNELLNNPMESLNIIEGRPKSVIEKAYQLRNDDITFEEFKKEINTILSNK